MRRIWIVFTLPCLSFVLSSFPAQARLEMYAIHSDHLGTPRVITDRDKQVVWRANPRPFGLMDVEVESITHHQRFPGQRFDIESGLHYNYFRDYDPSMGRYLEPDPIGIIRRPTDSQLQIILGQDTIGDVEIFDGRLNSLYGYVDQNPLLLIDPFGLFGTGSGQMGRRLPVKPRSCRSECTINFLGISLLTSGAGPAAGRIFTSFSSRALIHTAGNGNNIFSWLSLGDCYNRCNDDCEEK